MSLFSDLPTKLPNLLRIAGLALVDVTVQPLPPRNHCRVQPASSATLARLNRRRWTRSVHLVPFVRMELMTPSDAARVLTARSLVEKTSPTVSTVEAAITAGQFHKFSSPIFRSWPEM